MNGIKEFWRNTYTRINKACTQRGASSYAHVRFHTCIVTTHSCIATTHVCTHTHIWINVCVYAHWRACVRARIFQDAIRK